MIQRLRSHYEKMLLAGAFAAVAVALGWCRLMRSEFWAVRAETEQTEPGGPVHVSAALPSGAARHVWLKPPAQPRGDGWVYEVFTPPEIHFNAAMRSFAVTPPHSAVGAVETGLDLELVAVKHEPYRLQLAGYFGAPGDYLVAFVRVAAPQVLLAREGHRFEELGLALRRFEVRKVPVEADATGPVHDIAAQAVLFDEQAGGEVVLDSRSMTLTDTLLAVFRSRGGSARLRDMHEGDAFESGGATCRIERIQLDPAEVVVTCVAAGASVSERHVLRPAEGAGVPFAGREAPAVCSGDKSARRVAAQDP